MIDTHAHLTDERLMGQIESVLARAKEAGIETVIVPSTDLEESKKVGELVKNYDNVYGLVGIHPEEVVSNKLQNTNSGEELEKLTSSSKKIVGIGEIGLDFHYDPERKTKQRQEELFDQQMELAVKLNLPAMIHMREAEVEMRQTLDRLDKLPLGQFHCWSGSKEFLDLVLERGFYVSFCGNVTYKSAENLRQLVRRVPLERLLLETDSPYLPPETRRGSVNEPANVKIIAEYIAKLLDIQVETLIRQTTENTRCLFFAGS